MLTKQIGGALQLFWLTAAWDNYNYACACEGTEAHLSYKVQDVTKNDVLMGMHVYKLGEATRGGKSAETSLQKRPTSVIQDGLGHCHWMIQCHSFKIWRIINHLHALKS